MKRYKILSTLFVITALLGLSPILKAQINSPGRNWAGLTQYINQLNKQDSIFVFFSSVTSPQKGKLKAKFSDGALSNFIWYKYNDAIINPANRYVQIVTENGVTESNQINLERGGYKVSVTRISDNTTEEYTCWLMIDDVTITGITIDNDCNYLYLNTQVLPSRNTVIYDYFTYSDITRVNHPEINKIGTDYFKNLTWTASNSQVDASSSSLSILIEDPTPPLYDSKYTVRIQNPFGRVLTQETPTLLAKATKADFIVYVEKDGAWDSGGTEPTGEAPLTLKFESKSINTDSIYWRIVNDERLFYRGADSIIWRDSSSFSNRIDAFPPPEKMIPGKYPIEHISVKLSSGCRDTIRFNVEVDTSMIKTDAIPNVFSPNGDNVNEFFKLKDPEENIRSIKSFHIFILSRWGNLVYEYYGNPKEWEGWNGLMKGNRNEAPEGVYYYIIEAIGWDNKNYKGGVYKGFLHLFRGK